MPTLTIDGQQVTVPDGTTIHEAARQLGIEIPRLCNRDGKSLETSCMVCVVRVNHGRALTPSCSRLVEDGMVVESETPQIHQKRDAALRLLLSEHWGNCVSPCQSVCPAHLDISEMCRLLEAEQPEKAVACVRERIPIPAILGRICPELCEKGCRRGVKDAPVAIRLVKRYVGDFALSHNISQPEKTTAQNKNIAVIGAGPAGLSAAYYLSLKGYDCVIFDDREKAGGMLRYGVAPARLPVDVLDAELASVLSVGIECRSGVRVGQDISLEKIRQDFAAVVLATGNQSGEAPDIDGEKIQSNSHGETQWPDVFAAGAIIRPTHHAVRAVGEGQAVALRVHEYLSAEKLPPHRPWSVHMDAFTKLEIDEFYPHAVEFLRHEPVAGEAGGFNPAEANEEAQRCLHCDCEGLETCILRKYAAEHEIQMGARGHHPRLVCDTSHPQVIFEPGKCILCGQCVRLSAQNPSVPGLSFTRRGYETRIAPPFGMTLYEALGELAKEVCDACPTAALQWTGEDVMVTDDE